MIITYQGVEFFKVQFGDTILAFNPISKESKFKNHTTARTRSSFPAPASMRPKAFLLKVSSLKLIMEKPRELILSIL